MTQSGEIARLNPCSNGGRSARIEEREKLVKMLDVLILVLMEAGLRGLKAMIFGTQIMS